MQLTFVSHYGPKPAPFVEKIRLLQSMIAEQLGGRFEPYTVEQVHGTVIELEGARFETRIRNENFRRFRGTERFIDFQGLLDFLRTQPESDWDVRIGGYDLACDYGFTSAGQHPFLRSFSIRGEIAVAMGWPQSLGTVVPSLDELRRAFQQFGALHKWHQCESDVDNDFFFVLGRVSPDTEIGAVQFGAANHPRTPRRRAFSAAGDPCHTLLRGLPRSTTATRHFPNVSPWRSASDGKSAGGCL